MDNYKELGELFIELEHDIKRCSMDIAGGNSVSIEDALCTLEELKKEILKTTDDNTK